MALLRRGRHRVSLAILTSNSFSHSYGKTTCGALPGALLRGLGASSVPRGESGPAGEVAGRLQGPRRGSGSGRLGDRPDIAG